MIKSCLNCFRFFCVKLKKRIKYVKDPATFCCFSNSENEKDAFESSLFEDLSKSIYTSYINGSHLSGSTLSSSVLSSAGGGAGAGGPSLDTQLNDTITNALYENTNNYETDLNEKDNIRSSQEWPLHNFCFKLMSTLIDYLKLAPYDACTDLLPIICETLNYLVDILNETKQEWSNLNTSEPLMELFKKINLNIKASIKQQVSDDKQQQQQSRLVFIYLVKLLHKMINLMHSTNETSLLMPVELAEQIFFILNDTSLMNAIKSESGDEENVFSAILCHLDKSLYDIYEMSNEVADSMKNACKFLIKFSEANPSISYNSLDFINEMISLAKQSMIYMEYHECNMFPNRIVHFVSNICRHVNEDASGDDKSNSLMLGRILTKIISTNNFFRMRSLVSTYNVEFNLWHRISQNLNIDKIFLKLNKFT